MLQDDDPLAPIRKQFLAKLEGHADMIDSLLVEIENAAFPPATATMAQIGAIAHKVAGVSATLGYLALGEVAARLDSFVLASRYLEVSNAVATKELIALFLQELDFALDGITG